jgi:hypothetical protein
VHRGSVAGGLRGGYFPMKPRLHTGLSKAAPGFDLSCGCNLK